MTCTGAALELSARPHPRLPPRPTRRPCKGHALDPQETLVPASFCRQLDRGQRLFDSLDELGWERGVAQLLDIGLAFLRGPAEKSNQLSPPRVPGLVAADEGVGHADNRVGVLANRVDEGQAQVGRN